MISQIPSSFLVRTVSPSFMTFTKPFDLFLTFDDYPAHRTITVYFDIGATSISPRSKKKCYSWITHFWRCRIFLLIPGDAIRFSCIPGTHSPNASNSSIIRIHMILQSCTKRLCYGGCQLFAIRTLPPSCYGISFLICLKQFYPYLMILIKYSDPLLSQEVLPYSSDILALLASFRSSRV
jgi:hypothetical protein